MLHAACTALPGWAGMRYKRDIVVGGGVAVAALSTFYVPIIQKEVCVPTIQAMGTHIGILYTD